MMKIILRRAVRHDKDLIATMLNETGLPPAALELINAAYYIAEESGKAVGIAGFEFYGDDALLRSVVVRPGLQRRGVGSQVVDRMLDEARKKRIRSVVLLTESAKDFFLKKGFGIVDRSAIGNEAMRLSSEFTDACPQSAVCMKITFETA